MPSWSANRRTVRLQMSCCHLAVMKKFLCGRPAMALPSLIGWLLHITLVRGENTGQTVSTTVAGGEGGDRGGL